MQYENIQQLAAGNLYGAQRNPLTEPYEASSDLGFGMAAFGYKGDPDLATDIFTDQITITYSADFVASNSIAVTVNGNAIDAVTFDTDQETTINLVVEAIQALDEKFKAEVSGRVITITTPGENASASSTVTGGASQPTATIGTAVNSTDLVFLGPVLKAQKAPSLESDNSATMYVEGETLEVAREGYVVVQVDDIANCEEHSPVYVIRSGSNKGKFTGTASGNLLINATFHFLADKAMNVAVAYFDQQPKATA